MNDATEPPASEHGRYLEALLESSEDYILICDAQARPVLWNVAYARVVRETLGVEMQPGLQPHALLPDKEQVAWWEALHRRVLGGERFAVEFAFAPGDRPPRFFEFSFAPIVTAGEVTGFCEITRDITRRKESEKVLEDREQRHRLLLESTAAIPWEADLLADRIVYIGPQIETLLGHPRESWTDAASWLGRVHPEDREEAARRSREHIARGEDHTLVVRMVAADGRTVWVRIVATVVSRDGRPVALRGYVFDVTDIKTAEQENSRNRNLQALATLAGGIAHDFNNLLTAVFGGIELASGSVPPGSEAHGWLREALKGIERTRRLTRQLMAFTRGGVARNETIRIGTLLQETAAFALSGSRHGLASSIAPDLLPVDADRGRIEQVIQNLVLNARDASPAPGTIELTARNVAPGEQRPEPLAGRECVMFSVRDHGSGIPREHLDRVFDPYFTTKVRGEVRGTGLGLAVCHAIVSAHGGAITVVSGVGAGTTFTVYLPAASGPITGEPSPAPPTGGANRAPGKVLVVDDDESVQDVLRGVLRRLGHAVRIAQNGREAVEVFKAARASGAPFDAVILDLTVPGGMGGIETARALRRVDPTVRSVLISGYALPPTPVGAGREGIVAFVAKPFLISEVDEALRKALARGPVGAAGSGPDPAG